MATDIRSGYSSKHSFHLPHLLTLYISIDHTMNVLDKNGISSKNGKIKEILVTSSLILTEHRKYRNNKNSNFKKHMAERLIMT